jgi:HEPN domain-containing protein
MKPFTIYHFCKDAHFSNQQRLVDLIVNAANPAMIFLLGASLHRRRSESIFQQVAPTSQHMADYFLLILMEGFNNKEAHEWQDKIETHCKTWMPITTIVLQTTIFEEWLKEGHQFAAKVQQSAVVIYNSASYNLPLSQTANHDLSANSTEKHLTEGLTKAKEFLAGSELFRIRKQHAMSAFMLHQSTEQALRTLLKVGTGYHANTHSIERLLRYAGLVSYQLPDIFPQKTEEDKRLFSLLQKAYIDTRYKEDYKISNGDLLHLTEKVTCIHEILSMLEKPNFIAPALSIPEFFSTINYIR